MCNHKRLRKALVTLGLVTRDQATQWNVRVLVRDLRKPLPFRENAFSVVYASHVLEHLYLVEAQRLLCECRRVLKSGGVIRLVVPDLRSIIAEYLKKK